MVSPDTSRGEESHAGLSSLLAANVSNSGKTRTEISRQTSIHKDALRRILTGERAASLAEASHILNACGVDPKLSLALFILTDADQAIQWIDTEVGDFLGAFFTGLPVALTCELGSRLQEVRPRWAKGTAQRLARLLSDHIDDLERRDALYIENVNGRVDD
ncbi:helix-turn-helix transcriptional regulator [Erythrobacteraceae bacterium E2-1 Yellow Sea]|nr:helix-turn-helix transcriptional regulator [Erythrobacteraceae bacterium E2-1 Yellow Sea]